MSGAAITIGGTVLLAASLVIRHTPELMSPPAIFILSWAGSILVILGVGKIAFLEQH